MLSVLPSHIPRERALEEPSAVIMKLQSGYMLQEWTRRLRHSAAQMQSVAMWHSKQARAPASPRPFPDSFVTGSDCHELAWQLAWPAVGCVPLALPAVEARLYANEHDLWSCGNEERVWRL